MSGRRRSSISVGHDAFLDIVANLVGILIILVVVLGAQSQQTIREAKEQPETPEIDPLRRAAGVEDMDALALARKYANAAQADSMRLERTIKILDGEINQKAEQRAVLLTLLDEAKTIWESEQQKLDKDRLAATQRESKASQLARELASLEGEETRLENRKAPVVAVEHLPTPMAKTVFEKEFHFRLKDNRLSVVPLDALTKEIEDRLASYGGRLARRGRRSGDRAGPRLRGPLHRQPPQRIGLSRRFNLANGADASHGVRF